MAYGIDAKAYDAWKLASPPEDVDAIHAYESISLDDCRECEYGHPCTMLNPWPLHTRDKEGNWTVIPKYERPEEGNICTLKGKGVEDVPDGCPVAEARLEEYRRGDDIPDYLVPEDDC